MKLQLGQIQDMKDPMSRLTNEKLPLRVAFKLNKMIRVFDENLQVIEEERVKLVKALGEESDDGTMKVPKDNLEEFQKQYVELMMEEVEVDVIGFSIDDFGDAKVTTQDMLKLDAIFEE